MMRSKALPAILLGLLSPSAWAVPGQFTHQGRLLDVDSLPIEGEAVITFRLYDAGEDGSIVWEEAIDVSVTNGFYSAVLGTAETDNPLDAAVLDQAPLWLEIQLDGEDPMSPRAALNAVPYATLAGEAHAVAGGTVDATSVSIDATPVIDGDGNWVGPTPTIGWDDVADKPPGIEDDIDTVLSADDVLGYVNGSTLDLGAGSTMDGVPLLTTDDLVAPTWETLDGVPDDFRDGIDNDVLASLAAACSDGDVPHWDESTLEWACFPDSDTVLSVDEVRSAITDSPIDLADGSTMGGEVIATGPHTTTLNWATLTGIPAGFLDGTDDDTQLTAAEVLATVTSAAIDLATGSTIGGEAISTGSHTTTLDWSDISSIPSGFSDGVDDDNQLSAAEVVTYITEAAIDLAAETTIGGLDISTGAHTTSLSWSAITDIPAAFSDGTDDDTQLSEEEVLDYVTDSPIDFASGTTIDGVEIATGSGVPSGLIVMWSGSSPPDGWALCDGGSGTPDLRDRFVIGAGSSYGSGSTGGGTSGVSYSTSTAHHWGSSGLTVVTSVSGGGGLPPYYALAYIMKL